MLYCEAHWKARKVPAALSTLQCNFLKAVAMLSIKIKRSVQTAATHEGWLLQSLPLFCSSPSAIRLLRVAGSTGLLVLSQVRGSWLIEGGVILAGGKINEWCQSYNLIPSNRDTRSTTNTKDSNCVHVSIIAFFMVPPPRKKKNTKCKLKFPYNLLEKKQSLYLDLIVAKFLGGRAPKGWCPAEGLGSRLI